VTFAYYRRLTPSQRRIYDASDRIATVSLPSPGALHPFVAEIGEALAAERRAVLERRCQGLTETILAQLECPGAHVRVLAARPSRSWGELQGLYEAVENGADARITVWMRTARQRRVVAFRTFLRTLLHELLHHLDYVHFGLADSFHTEGFFKRESSLFRQLVP
jgi:hypothetical protein